MKFSRFSQYLQKLESTTSRNEMTQILAEMLREAPLAEVDKICYLALGRLGPLYEGVEFGISDKLMIKVIAQALGKETQVVQSLYKEWGDLGEVVPGFRKQKTESRKRILEDRKQKTEIKEVFEKLYGIATDSGEGSQERKIEGLANLISQLDPVSAKYLVRIPLGKLRLGFSDVTLLDALSWMLKGDKSARKEIEQAYVKSADIGKIARLVKKGGLSEVKRVKVEVGTPIKPAMSERLASAEEVVKKLGEFAVEPKVDGFRVQIHIEKNSKLKTQNSKLSAAGELVSNLSHLSNQTVLFKEFNINPDIFVKIFSRNLEDTTAMFPDIIKAAQQLPMESAILDGEAIAFDPETSEFLPFQETVQRKRKHGVAEAAKKVPLKVFVFDLLYWDGKSLLEKPFRERRQQLQQILKEPNPLIQVAKQHRVSSASVLHDLFDLYISEGLEGVMCKKLDAPYQAGARNFNWVKFKRATEGTGLADTIDAVVMGYYAGKGIRTQFGLGAFLVGVRDEKSGQFKTLAKIGTGLTEDQWQEMFERLQLLKAKEQPRQYLVHKNLIPDQWVSPSLVVEIKADEITRSPVHSVANAEIADLKGTSAGKRSVGNATGAVNGGNVGLALRFPRLISFRTDKSPEDATTVAEVVRLYQLQKK